MSRSFDLFLLPGRMAVCRLDPGESLPPWADSGILSSVTRTATETTVVCPEENAPFGVTCNKGWRCLRIAGMLDFSETGILSSLTAVLAGKGVSVYALSTYSTDLILVKAKDLSKAVLALKASGHKVFSENGREPGS